jgi:hypothetical protein
VNHRAIQNRAIQNRAIQNRAIQNRAIQNRAIQNRAIQNLRFRTCYSNRPRQVASLFLADEYCCGCPSSDSDPMAVNQPVRSDRFLKV